MDFKVTWTKECKVSIVKKDQDTGNALAGAVYGIYSDAACTKLIAEMPATDQNGASQLTMEKTQEVVYLKEISVPTGYQIDTKSYNVTLAIGKTTTKNVTDKRVNAKLNIANRMLRQAMKPRVMQHWKVRYMVFMQGKILFIRMEEPEQSIRKTA